MFAGLLSWILGLIIFFNGNDGITSTQIVIDVATDIILLTAVGAGLRFLLRSWRTNPPGDAARGDTR